MLTQTDNVTSPFRAWSVVIAAGLFFFFEFIQSNMFDAISTPLMNAFHMDAAQLGYLSSYYFIANVVFLFVAGILLDRSATLKIILVSLGICIIGIIMLSFSVSFYWAAAARFFMGIGSAFCFLSVIRLATRWFPPKKMAFVMGVVVTMAMTGGMIAQTPMTLLVQAVQWRHALWFDAGLGVLIFSLIAVTVRDYPPGHEEKHALEQVELKAIGYWKSFRIAFLRLQNWLGGIYTCLMNLPIGILGGLWGVLYLTKAHGLTKLDASYITSTLFFGSIIGCTFAGWISDRIGLRRLPMLIGAILSLALVLIIMTVSQLHFASLMVLFFLLGLLTSTQIISYALVAESSARVVTAMSVSVVNISVQAGSVIFQPFYGFLMDMKQLSLSHHISNFYVAVDFNWAMYLFPIGFVVALLTAWAVKETYCKSQH